MSSSNKSIGVFGGTFDPVHNGHISIAKSFLASEYIDELWVLLSPYPPHKEQQEVASYHHRLKMLKAVFDPVKNVIVSDLELRLPEPSYSVQTLSYLTGTYPDYQFYLCVGKDSIYSFTSWHRWQDILDYCELLVADRPISSRKDLPKKLTDRTHFINHDPLAVSSTEVRDKIKQGVSIANLVPPPVLQIIEKENIY